MHAVDDPKLDLNLLVVLGALLERGSVTGAARALGVTQPSVSHGLARLRVVLGDAILVRAGRGMVRTPRAEALVPTVRRLLGDARRVLSPDAGFDAATSSRAFSLACPDLLVAFLPELLGRLAREAPCVRLEARPPPADLAARLAEGGLDLAVLPARDEGPGLVQRVLGEVSWCVLARRGHPAVKKSRLSLAGWLRHPHVVVGTAEGTGVVGAELGRLGHARRVAFVAPSFLAAPHAVAHTVTAGLGGSHFQRDRRGPVPIALAALCEPGSSAGIRDLQDPNAVVVAVAQGAGVARSGAGGPRWSEGGAGGDRQPVAACGEPGEPGAGSTMGPGPPGAVRRIVGGGRVVG